jgi:glycosyltransferase involved in cell wall biosynthesis
LFGAAKLTYERKGAAYLKEACRILKEKHPELDDRIELLLMGKAQEDILGYFPYPTRSFGYLSSETELVKAYSAATLFVIPSLEDNLPTPSWSPWLAEPRVLVSQRRYPRNDRS